MAALRPEDGAASEVPRGRLRGDGGVLEVLAGRQARLAAPCRLDACAIRRYVQSGASYLSQGFVMFFHVSCEGLPGQ